MSNEEKYLKELQDFCNKIRRELPMNIVLAILTTALCETGKFYGHNKDVVKKGIDVFFD